MNNKQSSTVSEPARQFHRLTHLIGLLGLSAIFASGSAYAGDVVFMNGFGNVSVAITYPVDGETLNIPGATGVYITFVGSASVPATLVWTDSVTGYLGTGETIVHPNLALGMQQFITLKATAVDGEYAVDDVQVMCCNFSP